MTPIHENISLPESLSWFVEIILGIFKKNILFQLIGVETGIISLVQQFLLGEFLETSTKKNQNCETKYTTKNCFDSKQNHGIYLW